jgi:hypothetical protein
MTSSATLETRQLIGLAERMCIPTDAAIRQVEQLANRRSPAPHESPARRSTAPFTQDPAREPAGARS